MLSDSIPGEETGIFLTMMNVTCLKMRTRNHKIYAHSIDMSQPEDDYDLQLEHRLHHFL
jgi:hypothetical protein